MLKISRIYCYSLALALLCGAGTLSADEHGHKDQAHAHKNMPVHGIAIFRPTQGNMVRGRLVLLQTEEGLKLTGRVTGLTPGEHGFHIHEFGDQRDPKGLSAGGHYNPDGHQHGGPHSKERHAGDLGNITANAEGVAQVDMIAKGVHLHFVLGRSFVVHADKDDLTSQPAGDAGPRVAVAIIALAQAPEKK